MKVTIVADDTLTHVQRSPFFEGASIAALSKIAAAARIKSVARDYVIFSRGEQADAAYLVLRGEVSIEVTNYGGKTTRIATLGSGAMLGELGVLDGHPRTADARIIKSGQILRIPKHAIVEMFREESEFALNLVIETISKLRKTNIEVESLLSLGLEQRVAELLLGLVSEDTEEGLSISITQFELANRLNASRERVNSSLQRLRRLEIIDIERGKITILNIEYLQRLAKPVDRQD